MVLMNIKNLLLVLFILCLPRQAAAVTWTIVHDYIPSGGPSAATASPGTINAYGWSDSTGSVWSLPTSNTIGPTGQAVASGSNDYNMYDSILRPTSEAATDQQLRVTFTAGSDSNTALTVMLHETGAYNSPDAYLINMSTTALKFYQDINGGFNQVGATTTLSLVSGTQYYLTASVTESGGTSTLTATITNVSTSAVMGTYTYNDTTSALQPAGVMGVYEYVTTVANYMPISELTTYTDAPASTGYTLSGPSSGSVGTASTFTVTTNGTLASSDTVTPSDSGGGGSFSPTTATLPVATSGTSSVTFNYTAASIGTKTITTTNSQSLTQSPSGGLSYSVSGPPITLLPSSTAAHFSPSNWQCYGSRGCASGVTYPRSWNPGAYFCYSWNASSSPSANILFSTNSSSVTVSYYLNGVLTDGVAANGSVSLSGLTSSAVNQLFVVVKSTPASTSWGITGTNGNYVEIDGLQVDSNSSAATALAPCQPSGDTTVSYKGWGLYNGDSINVGYHVDSGTDNFLHSSTFMVMQGLLAQGYDIGFQGATGNGFLATGNGGTIPLCVTTTTIGCTEGSSRWDLTDAGISMKDTGGYLSAYGATGTQPAFIFQNEGTNDANQSVNQTYLPNSVAGLLLVERAAAPTAKIILLLGFPIDANTVSGAATYKTLIVNGSNLHANDAAYTFSDFGYPFGNMIYNNNVYHYDTFHPLEPGNSLIAPKIQALISKAISPTGGSYFHNGFH